MTAVVDRLALLVILGYRRFLSPYKGFRCAYGVVRGRGSCSDVGLRLARRFGARRTLALMPLQAARCRVARIRLMTASDGEDNPEKQRSIDACGEGSSARCANFACIACISDCPWW